VRIRLSYLAILVAVATVTAGIAGVVLTYQVAGHEFRDVLDDDLEQQCRMLARLLEAEPAGAAGGRLEELLRKSFRPDDEETLWVTVYNLATGTMASNQHHSLGLASAKSGSARITWDGHDWEGCQQREGDLVIQLLRRTDLYAEVQEEILEDIATPALAGSAVMLLLLAALIGALLWPLSRLVRELAARHADSLAPLALKTPVDEIQLLVDTLNRLMGGVDTVLGRERQFASDVAHELRTPLTTLKVELADPAPDLPAIKAEIDRLARLVEQLLTLARLDQGRWRASFSRVDLAQIWALEEERIAAAATRAGMTLVTESRPTLVDGDPTLLQALLQNLAGNVLRHCPAGTHLRVFIGDDEGQPAILVSDTGPGIPAGQLEQMNAGFKRLDSRGGGLGLGLAICRRIADAHGAVLKFLAGDEGQRGLRVLVRFPP